MAVNVGSEDLLLIDWFSFSLKNVSIIEAPSFIGLDGVPWIDTKGARGYSDRKYFAGISIHYNGRPDMGIWFEFSGAGCRSFEDFSSLDWFSLFRKVLDNLTSNITRLDIAFDDHSGIFPLYVICQDVLDNNFVSPSRFYEVVQSSKGSSVYIGSPASMIRLRFYDKAAERSVPGHWIRLEMQLRSDRALQFTNLLYNNKEDAFNLFRSVVYNQIRFVSPGLDSNKSRWFNTSYWDSFVADSLKVRLCTDLGSEYNLDDLYFSVFKRWGNAIDTVLQTMDIDEFIERLKGRNTSTNPKYEALLNEFFHRYSK